MRILNMEQIVKALENCQNNERENTCAYCTKCPAGDADFDDDVISDCIDGMLADAISLIKELTEENERLENALVEQSAENVMLIGENKRLIEAGFDTVDYAVDKIRETRADTVRKMQEMLKQVICDSTYPDFNKDGKPVNVWKAKTGYDLIDEVAEEILTTPE